MINCRLTRIISKFPKNGSAALQVDTCTSRKQKFAKGRSPQFSQRREKPLAKVLYRVSSTFSINSPVASNNKTNLTYGARAHQYFVAAPWRQNHSNSKTTKLYNLTNKIFLFIQPIIQQNNNNYR